MFVVLESLPKEKRGILGWLREILMPAAPTVRPRSLGGVAFLQIKAGPNRRGEWDWDWIGEGIPRGAVLLLPKGIPRPAGLPGPEMGWLTRALLRRAAVEVLEGCGRPLYQKTVGLIDREGEHLELGEVLLCHAAVLRVVTENRAGYEAFAGEMLERYGASVLVGDGVESLLGSLFVVSPERYETGGAIPPACPVLAGAPQRFGGRSQVVEDWGVAVPSGVAAQSGEGLPWVEGLPPGIDPLEFLAAAGEGAFATLTAQGEILGRCGKRMVTPGEIGRYLAGIGAGEKRA